MVGIVKPCLDGWLIISWTIFSQQGALSFLLIIPCKAVSPPRPDHACHFQTHGFDVFIKSLPFLKRLTPRSTPLTFGHFGLPLKILFIYLFLINYKKPL